MVLFLSILQFWFKNLLQIKTFLFLFSPIVSFQLLAAFDMLFMAFLRSHFQIAFFSLTASLDKFNFQLQVFIPGHLKSVLTTNLICPHSTICTSDRPGRSPWKTFVTASPKKVTRIPHIYIFVVDAHLIYIFFVDAILCGEKSFACGEEIWQIWSASACLICRLSQESNEWSINSRCCHGVKCFCLLLQQPQKSPNQM